MTEPQDSTYTAAPLSSYRTGVRYGLFSPDMSGLLRRSCQTTHLLASLIVGAGR